MAAQQVRVDAMRHAGTRPSRPPSWVGGANAHQAHQAPQSLLVDRDAFLLKLINEPPATQVHPVQVDLVQNAYHLTILGGNWRRLLVDAGMADAQQAALPVDV